ncbi:MAG: hypothetical protein DRO23_06600 [Thermoprotei archaeon]|nr:MAG: hypothetical protein DRO23_06600 [Thermoprotei archaeon]
MRETFLANSTFFLLLLKDIKKPEVLAKIGQCVRLATTKQVLEEVKRGLAEEGLEHLASEVREYVSEIYDATDKILRTENPLVVHEPFLGTGEFSIILAFWYLQYRRNIRNLYIITDDKSARKYIYKNIPEIPKNRILWSLKFIDRYAVFLCNISPEEFLEILDLIEKSKFRVDKKILEFYRRKYMKYRGSD